MKNWPKIWLCGVLFCAWLSAEAPELDGLWSSGLEKLQAEDYAGAAPLFEKWIDEAAEQNKTSADAHYNLALAAQRTEDLARTQFHLVRATDLTDSPFTAYLQINQIRALELELGLADRLSDAPSFILTRVFTPNMRVVLLGLGTWMFLAGLLSLWARWSTWLGGTAIVLGLLFAAFLPALMLWEKSLPAFAVMSNEKNSVLIYEEAKADPSLKLVALPSGTLVNTAEAAGEFTRVSFPVAGWVPTSHLMPF